MADGNGRKPRLLDASGGAIRDDSDPRADIGLLFAQVQQLRGAWENAQSALRVHQHALAELTSMVGDMERRTLRGRARRAKAWLELQREVVRGYAIELGILSPVPPAPRPDIDNPEAMPK